MTQTEDRSDDSATGGCRCGAVRYRVTGPARSTSLCHCHSCRRATGGPSLAWAIFDEDKVTFERGAPVLYQSSPGVERGFCERCGTSLTYRRANRPGLFDVTTGSLDEPERFAPTKEIWTSQRLSWIAANSDLPQFAEFSVATQTNDA